MQGSGLRPAVPARLHVEPVRSQVSLQGQTVQQHVLRTTESMPVTNELITGYLAVAPRPREAREARWNLAVEWPSTAFGARLRAGSVVCGPRGQREALSLLSGGASGRRTRSPFTLRTVGVVVAQPLMAVVRHFQGDQRG